MKSIENRLMESLVARPGTYNADKLSLARAAGARCLTLDQLLPSPRFGASNRFSPPERPPGT